MSSIRRVAIGATALGLAIAALVAVPAHAAPLAACQWIDGEIESTYECSDFADSVTSVDLVDCWTMPPSPRTYVRYKTSSGWVRSADMQLRIRGGKGCPEGYSYKTIVTVAPTMLKEMAATRFRLVMPATSGTFDDSTTYSYSKTVVTYGACLVPEGTVDYCPAR